MKKVMVYWTNRSEVGLLKPVIQLLEAEPGIEVVTHEQVAKFSEFVPIPENLGSLLNIMFMKIKHEQPDLVLAPFDRVEMLMAATAAMTNRVPVAQMHAGDIAGPGTWDDKVRYAITMIADLVFCNGDVSYSRVVRMFRALHDEGSAYFTLETTNHIHEVGSTALDGIKIDNSLCPSKLMEHIGPRDPPLYVGGNFLVPYDLVLYNPPTAHPEEMDEDLINIRRLLRANGIPVIWIGPNSDEGSGKIIQFAQSEGFTFFLQVPREQFLGLMQNCERFIGNSSSMFLEAPAFLKEEQIVNIGSRNRDRQFIKIRMGGAKRIVEHIKKFLEVE